MDNVTKYQCRAEAFKSSFFPWTITEWNSLDLQIRNLSYAAFRKHFFDEFRPTPNSVFNIHNPVGMKLLTRLRLGLSHLNEHRFNHKFQNCTSPKCICSFENESTTHFFLHCHFYIPIRATLFDNVKEIVNNLRKVSEQTVTEMLLYGSPNLKGNQNSKILECTIKYIMDSKRFTSSLFSCRTITVFFLNYEYDVDYFTFFVNPLIFLLKAINNTEKFYSHKKHFSSS